MSRMICRGAEVKRKRKCGHRHEFCANNEITYLTGLFGCEENFPGSFLAVLSIPWNPTV